MIPDEDMASAVRSTSIMRYVMGKTKARILGSLSLDISDQKVQL